MVFKIIAIPHAWLVLGLPLAQDSLVAWSIFVCGKVQSSNFYAYFSQPYSQFHISSISFMRYLTQHTKRSLVCISYSIIQQSLYSEVSPNNYHGQISYTKMQALWDCVKHREFKCFIFILHSKSHVGAHFFFVKTKDGALWLVVDCWGLNKIIVACSYLPPLLDLFNM